MDGMLSQEEINALLGSMGDSAENTSDVVASEPTPAAADSNERLSPEESDALGEIANISMGTAATTLSIFGKQPGRDYNSQIILCYLG